MLHLFLQPGGMGGLVLELAHSVLLDLNNLFLITRNVIITVTQRLFELRMWRFNAQEVRKTHFIILKLIIHLFLHQFILFGPAFFMFRTIKAFIVDSVDPQILNSYSFLIRT